MAYLVLKTDSVWQVAVCVCVARTQIQFWEPFINLSSIGQTENDDVSRF